jgi:hypothetical protein
VRMRTAREQSALVHFSFTLLGVVTGLFRFLASLVRSRSALIAENLFLRKQLAFYQERQVEPHRLTDAGRLCLVLWSRLFNWREALVLEFTGARGLAKRRKVCEFNAASIPPLLQT